MNIQLLFIQGGGGKEDFEADAKLVDSLEETLGEGFTIHYPRLPTETASDLGRCKQIEKEIMKIEEEFIMVAHSLGASMLLKYLSENKAMKKIAGLFLVSTPFWSGDEDWKEGFKLQENFADKLPKDVPIFFYHCMDDEVVPFEHLSQYAQKLPHAIIREITSGGHQLNNNLAIVAKDIKSL